MTMLRVSEMFGPTLQGEGVDVGKKMIFVRFAGCDYRCSWCDTQDAWKVRDGKRMSVKDVLEGITYLAGEETGPIDVALTGGNPFLQPAIGDLIDATPVLWSYHIETQGSVFKPWVNDWKVKRVTLSPKLPNAGLQQDPSTIEHFLGELIRPAERAVLKIVVFDEKDMDLAWRWYNKFMPWVCGWIFQVGTLPTDISDDVIERWRLLTHYALERDMWNVRVLPQTHVLLWGHKKGV